MNTSQDNTTILLFVQVTNTTTTIPPPTTMAKAIPITISFANNTITDCTYYYVYLHNRTDFWLRLEKHISNLEQPNDFSSETEYGLEQPHSIIAHFHRQPNSFVWTSIICILNTGNISLYEYGLKITAFYAKQLFWTSFESGCWIHDTLNHWDAMLGLNELWIRYISHCPEDYVIYSQREKEDLNRPSVMPSFGLTMHATPLTSSFVFYTACHWRATPSTLPSICSSNIALNKVFLWNDSHEQFKKRELLLFVFF